MKRLNGIRKGWLKACFILVVSAIISGCGAHWRSAQNAHKGHNRLDEGKPDEAIEYFELALKEKALPGIYFGLHSAYLMKGDLLSARDYLIKGINLYPEDKFLNFAAGKFNLHFEKDYETAIYFLKIAKEKFRERSIQNEIDRLIDEAEAQLAPEP